MNKRFHQIIPASPFIIFLLWLPLISGLNACRKSEKNKPNEQLKTWIDSLDRSSRIVGVKESVKTLDSLVATLGTLSLTDQVQYYKFMKVLSHRDSTRAADALLYTDSLMQLFPSVQIREENPIDYSRALLLKGDDLLKQKDYYRAYRNYYNGKSFLLGLGEICECARYSSRIANISYEEENYYQAIQYWKQELKELAECTDKENFQLQFIEKQGSLRNIGIAHIHRNEPDIALEYFKKAEDFIAAHAKDFPREHKFIRFAKLVILKNKAEAYALKGETQTAESLIKRCLQHDNEIEWSLDVEQESRLILTKLYIDTKQFTKAREQLDLLKSVTNAPDPESERLYGKLQGAISYGLGDFETAGKLFVANMEAERIADLKNNAENKSDVGQLLQQIQREHEIDLEAEQDARQKVILNFALIISISLCVIVYLIWRSAQKSASNLLAVTELNRAITQSNIVLQDTVNALEQAEMENEAVLKIIAHDLRNPIASMMSASQLLFWDLDPSADQQEIITGIQEAGQRANGLIGQILQSTPDRDKIIKSEVALEEIVQSCIDMLSYKASEKHQKIGYQFEKVTVSVDREKIWRVFCNLLSNAIKFSPAGGTIRVALQVQTGKVLLAVQDNGIGIPAELKDQIFVHLSSAKRSGTAGEQSFGIGLSICKQIVEAHGGRIWFESAGDGTTFFVELPA
ncbi:HAMP domain-containing sensor histidine kinase [Dyadobacter sp. Leaf189]|uniref:sensor histidine kinase n=1 Tax=Dyadobacter sp. Leaf189 TaxID=1736295 RepID=UPI0009E9608B|nr:HAMP domain-containing sensor histidine kinase [Dyadobacter sp. Leaf189]